MSEPHSAVAKSGPSATPQSCLSLSLSGHSPSGPFLAWCGGNGHCDLAYGGTAWRCVATMNHVVRDIAQGTPRDRVAYDIREKGMAYLVRDMT